jgi:hypothetical protein
VWEESRDSSVGIRLGYGLHFRGIRVRLPAGVRDSSLLLNFLAGSGAHNGYRGLFSRRVVTSTWWEGLVLPMIPRAMPAGA